MNRYIKKYKYIILTIIVISFITNLDIVLSSTKSSSILFFNTIFISTFPFIILSDILIYYDYHIFLNKIFGKFFSKLFNINPNSSIVIILSILTSQPSNSIFIKDLLDNKELDISSSNKLITFTYFSSIPFVIGTIGISLYNSFKIGLIIYIFCFLNNILIGIFLRKEKINNALINNKIQNKTNLFDVLKKSFLKGINTSIIILGNLIIFTIITNIISNYITNDIITTFISGVLELTNGVTRISSLNINLSIKIALTIFFLSFSGLSIIFQSKSILADYNINIKKILIIKLVFSIFTSLLFYLLESIFSYNLC